MGDGWTTSSYCGCRRDVGLDRVDDLRVTVQRQSCPRAPPDRLPGRTVALEKASASAACWSAKAALHGPLYERVLERMKAPRAEPRTGQDRPVRVAPGQHEAARHVGLQEDGAGAADAFSEPSLTSKIPSVSRRTSTVSGWAGRPPPAAPLTTSRWITDSERARHGARARGGRAAGQQSAVGARHEGVRGRLEPVSGHLRDSRQTLALAPRHAARLAPNAQGSSPTPAKARRRSRRIRGDRGSTSAPPRRWEVAGPSGELLIAQPVSGDGRRSPSAAHRAPGGAEVAAEELACGHVRALTRM